MAICHPGEEGHACETAESEKEWNHLYLKMSAEVYLPQRLSIENVYEIASHSPSYFKQWPRGNVC